MVNYDVRGYEQAENIVDRLVIGNAPSMRSFVASFTNPGYADSLDYRGLVRESRKIRGIAQKMLRTREEVIERKANEGQLELFLN
jgi:hypothetical protein